jgi:hypothetical protein
MADRLIVLRWRVRAGGYAWESGHLCRDREGPPVRVLVERTSRGAEPEFSEYDPLSPQHAALFRTFADTEPTEDGVSAFAAKYGPLTAGETVEVGPLEKAPAWRGIYGEAWHLWRSHLSLMRQMIDLWDMIVRGDSDALRDHIRWEKDERGEPLVSYDSHPHLHRATHSRDAYARRQEVIASTQTHQEQFARFPEGDVVLPAVVCLRRAITRSLAGQVSAALVEVSGRPSRSVLRFKPGSLAGALWFQFAEAVSFEKQQRQCDQCRKWFAIPEHGSRSDKRFCGTPCRLKAYRQRQQRAQHLHGQGKTFKEIAAELGSDEEKVKGWIKSTREK